MTDPVVARSLLMEQQTIFTLLGVRFWDPLLDDLVSDGLQVTAWPDGEPEAARTAFRTGTGVYAFRGLPGMRHLEYPANGDAPWDAPPVRFIVQALDARRRYLSLVFAMNVPYRGVFPTATAQSPVLPGATGCWLFSAPARWAPPAVGVVRAQLVEANTEQGIANAVVAVEVGGETWYGISGEDGQMVVFFPLPDFTSLAGYSSPVTAVPRQSWPLTLRVQHDPAFQETPAGAVTPDVGSLFGQPGREIWLSDTGTVAAALTTEFIYGEELVLQTAGRTVLWLQPVTSPL